MVAEYDWPVSQNISREVNLAPCRINQRHVHMLEVFHPAHSESPGQERLAVLRVRRGPIGKRRELRRWRKRFKARWLQRPCFVRRSQCLP
jgi:hypothetical protein